MMRIYDQSRLAKAVLELVLWQLGPDKLISLSIEPYHNGRERGICIVKYGNASMEDVAVVFSENRNSDHIVVYTGRAYKDFDINYIPMESIYRAASYFEPLEIWKAVDHIVRSLYSAVESETGHE